MTWPFPIGVRKWCSNIWVNVSCHYVNIFIHLYDCFIYTIFFIHTIFSNPVLEGSYRRPRTTPSGPRPETEFSGFSSPCAFFSSSCFHNDFFVFCWTNDWLPGFTPQGHRPPATVRNFLCHSLTPFKRSKKDLRNNMWTKFSKLNFMKHLNRKTRGSPNPRREGIAT
jgi:hypothetical protein